jgi:hypothetical protein
LTVRRSLFVGLAAGAVGLCALQSAIHLALTVGAGRVDSIFDVDRSNGVPDLLSTVVLGLAAAAALKLAGNRAADRRAPTVALALALVLLTVADAVHDGPHPSSTIGWVVIVTVLATVALTAYVAGTASRQTRMTLGVAAAALAASFLVKGLDRLDHWFERERPDPVVEYQIAAKEGLELLGWSLVALALWNQASRPRGIRRRAVSEDTRRQAGPPVTSDFRPGLTKPRVSLPRRDD